MSKHTYFIGQPVLAQIIKLIPRSLVSQLSRRHNADRYCKRFYSWDHLISMLFASLSGCGSLREVTTGMLAAEGKLRHLGLRYTPRRSTLSDANNRRPEAFFADLFHELARYYLPDSRRGGKKTRALYIVDSTTISLFSDVMANAGRPGKDGRRKGGVKAHTLINAEHNRPEFVVLTPGASHDTPFLGQLSLPKGSIVCFDKGYLDYTLFAQWSAPEQEVGFVSRLRANAVVEVVKEFRVGSHEQAGGVLSDQRVILGHTHHARVTRLPARLVRYRCPDTGKEFTFMSNLFDLSALQITRIYRQRWQIELVFKRIKGAWPLRYFLGESANAIKIQIWCALIADLLLELLRSRCPRKWSYANLRGMIRLHCLSYVELGAFLRDPFRALLQYKEPDQQSLSLFPGAHFGDSS